MAYLSHAPIPDSSHLTHELEMRKKAVQKFLARAEISMVTRALRARLSYASYKATHSVPHVPIRELEGQLASQASSSSHYNRSIPAKRKPAGTSIPPHFSNASISQSNAIGAGASAVRRGVSASMPPPVSPRSHHSNVHGSSAGPGNKSLSTPANKPSPSAPSLYASILAPPSQVARTIHNASDPPVPPSSRPAPSPRVRAVKASPKSVADGSRTHSKAKQPDKKALASPERRKKKRASLEKGKGKQPSTDLDADGDIDMKAAATLTSLLLNHRSSLSGTSPRSSIDGSETGSAYSYSHFAQSSARSTTATSPPASISSASTMTGAESSFRQQTPPPSLPPANFQSTTPRPAPTDNEAADLMLFLATSPSPARPTPKVRNSPAHRTLGSDPSMLRSKGRILFPSASMGDIPMNDDPLVTSSRAPTALARPSDATYGDIGARNNADMRTPSVSAPGQLLPPPPLPSRATPDSPVRRELPRSPRTLYGSAGSTDFNFNEFINASPSPSRPTHKPNLSLRADVGRKLFEEEQTRHSMNVAPSTDKQHEDGSLGAGIDIIQG